MRELSNETATYGTFEAKAYFPVTDWEAAEASCHYELDEYRDDKEFFKAPYNELVEAVRSVCEEYQPEAHADKPTDGMSKALFLEPAPPARPDPQYVPPEQTTDHPDKSGSSNNHLWVIGAAVTSVGYGLYIGSNVIEKIWAFVSILFWWGLAYWVVGKFKSGAWEWRIAVPLVVIVGLFAYFKFIHKHFN